MITRQRRLLLYGCGIMMNLHSILCKVNANSNKLFLLFERHNSFRFQYRLLTMITFCEIVVYMYKPLLLLMLPQLTQTGRVDRYGKAAGRMLYGRYALNHGQLGCTRPKGGDDIFNHNHLHLPRIAVKN